MPTCTRATLTVFQSTLLIRGATRPPPHPDKLPEFQSTLLIRGATRILPYFLALFQANFNPRSSYEERLNGSIILGYIFLFQSTLLIREATRRGSVGYGSVLDFNPRTSYEERPCRARHSQRPSNFNPRSSYEERLSAAQEAWQQVTISIHAPHTRSDQGIFISSSSHLNFNPRSSYEERHQVQSLRDEIATLFQSTLLIRGATFHSR